MKLGISILFVLVVNLFHPADAQERFYTKSGLIRFYSKSPLENIEAQNNSVTCVLDTKTGNFQFAVLMKGFEFRKALMQEHFNENYVESHKFPKSEFKGQVLNIGEINFGKEGSYPVKVKGRLSIHGETREIESTGKMVIKRDGIGTNAEFNILLSDYNISIPTLVKDKVSNKVKITVSCLLEPLKL
jgi:hypothetical protein